MNISTYTNDITNFEKLNSTKINVFIYNGSYEKDYDRNENTINLLLLENEINIILYG